MGSAIGEVILATNANLTLEEFFKGDDYPSGRPGLETLANAMDVGDPRQLRAPGLVLS